jgi:hypothetical protein
MGAIVGFIAAMLGRKQTPYDDRDDFFPFEVQEETKET